MEEIRNCQTRTEENNTLVLRREKKTLLRTFVIKKVTNNRSYRTYIVLF